jgi:hypothetical protein
MKNLTFLKLSERVLDEEKKPLTNREIWEIAAKKGYTELLSSEGKTPEATISSRIYVDMRDNPDTLFKTVGVSPRRFGLKKYNYKEEDILIPEKKEIKRKYLEKHLHPFLTYYAFYYLDCYSKTINHLKSEKNAYSEWMHPDMVGWYVPFDKQRDLDVFEFSKAIGDIPVVIYSFELKRELNENNIRESYFQAVSNSSWAHEGYLVAAEISEDKEFKSELKRLVNAYGIGIIKLELDNPENTHIMYNAKRKDVLDWDTIDKLCKNKDFSTFIKRVRNDINNKEIIRNGYDDVKELEQLKKILDEFNST